MVRTSELLGLLIEIRNTDGDLLEIARDDVIAAEWSFAAQGGYERATISLARDFNEYGDIDLDYDIRIFIESALTARWTGFVRSIKPVFDELESVRLSCAGYSRQLDYIAVPDQMYASQDVGAIVRDVLDNFVVPGTQIERSNVLGLVQDVGVVVSSTGLTFDTSARQVIESLAAIGGNAEWGVRSDFAGAFFEEQFYFNARSNALNQTHLIGDRARFYEEEMSTDDVVRRVYIRGANGFKATATSSLGNPAGFQKERVMLLPFISDAADATLWATAFFSKFESAQPRARLIISAVDRQIDDFRPLGTLRVMGGTVQQWEGVGGTWGSGTWGDGAWGVDTSSPYHAERVGSDSFFRDFRINRVTYRFGSAGLEATVELGETRTALEDYFQAIEFKFGELRQVAV